MRHCWRCGRRLAAVPPTTCGACGEVHYVNPKPCGNAAVVRGAGREAELLFVLRAREPDAGTWTLPGGFCEDGEHPRDAALRELGEEAGVRGRAVAYLGTWMDRYGPPAPDGLEITTAVSGYLCEVTGAGAGGLAAAGAGAAAEAGWEPDPAEVREVAWWPLDAPPEPLAFPAHVPGMVRAATALVRSGLRPPMYDVPGAG